MADLSRLVEDLRLSNNPGERSHSRWPRYRNSIETIHGPGIQGTASHAWNARSDFQNLQLKVLDSTSRDQPYPPFDLDSRLAGSLQSPEAVPEHLLQSLGLLRDSTNRPGLTLRADHDKPQAPTPNPAIQGDDESGSWITTSLDSNQDHHEHSVVPVRARRSGFSNSAVGLRYGHSLLGSSIADISDNSSVLSFKTRESLVQSKEIRFPSLVQTPPPTQDLETPRLKPRQSTIPRGRKRLTLKSTEQRVATVDIEHQHHTPPGGPILIAQTNEGPECHSVARISLDHNKPQPPTNKTKPIATEGSSLKISSPSYAKPIKVKREPRQQNNGRKRLTELNLRKFSNPPAHNTLTNTRVQDWLKDAEAIAVTENLERSDADAEACVEPESFRIWTQDAEPCIPSINRPHLPSARSKALQDITNLRQPGYLAKNSFFQDKERGY